MRGALLAFAVTMSLAACGPGIDVEIELKRDGSQQRAMSIPGPEDDKLPSDAELETARKVYETERVVDGNVVRFEGTFSAAPADLAFGDDENRGRMTSVDAPYGTVYAYRESLPGRTDFFAAIQEIGTWVDTHTRIFSRLVTDELAGEAGLDRLVARIEGPFRRDLKDLLTLWMGSSWYRDSKQDDFPTVRVATVELLEERGYVTAEEAPRLLPPFERISLDSFALPMAKIEQTMGRAGDPKLRAKLEGLLNEEAYERAREKLGIADEAAVLRPRLLTIGDKHVGFKLGFEGRRPFATNGEWDPETQKVSWSASLTDQQVGRPILFAAWAVPNEAWQRAHFGGLGLDGSELGALMEFESGLSDAAREDWTRRLGALRHDDPATIVALRKAEQGDAGAKIVLEALERAKANRSKSAK